MLYYIKKSSQSKICYEKRCWNIGTLDCVYTTYTPQLFILLFYAALKGISLIPQWPALWWEEVPGVILRAPLPLISPFTRSNLNIRGLCYVATKAAYRLQKVHVDDVLRQLEGRKCSDGFVTADWQPFPHSFTHKAPSPSKNKIMSRAIGRGPIARRALASSFGRTLQRNRQNRCACIFR